MEVIPPKRTAFPRQPAAFFHHLDDFSRGISPQHPLHILWISKVHDSLDDIRAMNPKINGPFIRVPKQPLNPLRDQIGFPSFFQSITFLSSFSHSQGIQSNLICSTPPLIPNANRTARQTRVSILPAWSATGAINLKPMEGGILRTYPLINCGV